MENLPTKWASCPLPKVRHEAMNIHKWWISFLLPGLGITVRLSFIPGLDIGAEMSTSAKPTKKLTMTRQEKSDEYSFMPRDDNEIWPLDKMTNLLVVEEVSQQAHNKWLELCVSIVASLDVFDRFVKGKSIRMLNFLAATSVDRPVIGRVSVTLQLVLPIFRMQRKRRPCKKSDEFTTRKRTKKSCSRHSKLRIFVSCRENYKSCRKRNVARKSKNEVQWWCLKPRNGKIIRNLIGWLAMREFKKKYPKVTLSIDGQATTSAPVGTINNRFESYEWTDSSNDSYDGFQAHQETVSDRRKC